MNEDNQKNDDDQNLLLNEDEIKKEIQSEIEKEESDDSEAKDMEMIQDDEEKEDKKEEEEDEKEDSSEKQDLAEEKKSENKESESNESKNEKNKDDEENDLEISFDEGVDSLDIPEEIMSSSGPIPKVEPMPSKTDQDQKDEEFKKEDLIDEFGFPSENAASSTALYFEKFKQNLETFVKTHNNRIKDYKQQIEILQKKIVDENRIFQTKKEEFISNIGEMENMLSKMSNNQEKKGPQEKAKGSQKK